MKRGINASMSVEGTGGKESILPLPFGRGEGMRVRGKR
jgi:hypothetical protein